MPHAQAVDAADIAVVVRRLLLDAAELLRIVDSQLAGAGSKSTQVPQTNPVPELLTVFEPEPETEKPRASPRVRNNASPTPAEKRVLDVLNGQPPRKGEWIAAKLGRVYGGGFRAMLSNLLRLGLIVRGPDNFGYVLPDRAGASPIIE